MTYTKRLKKEMNDDWREVVEMYQTRLGIPEKIVNYLADYDILHSCCVGMSNPSIARELDLDEDTIRNVLIQNLNFKGWEKDLDISPLFMYNKANGNKEFYWALVMAVKDLLPKYLVNKSFVISKKFLKIEREINKYYG